MRPAVTSYTIPIVFHVIYTTPYGNISDAQIIDQVAILNKEFKRLQADTALTPVPFKSLAAPFDVEFRLATKDPNGNCTNGINRVYSTLTNCSVREDDVKAVSYWPSNQYLNIWLTQTMHYSGNTSCNGGGYAQFPGVGAASTDGVNIRGDLISNIGTAASNPLWGNFKGRYLVHELGHWFNLRHIWGDATCGNDLVSDTPPAQTSNSGCPSFPHNANNTCGSGPNGEMFTDYMDYTDGPCLNMFTAGQVARMTAAINSPISGRSNLWSATNLNATGTSNPYVYPVACTAVPDVLPNGAIVICVNDSVKITDNSYGGLSTSRQWSFGNSAVASSLIDSIVWVKYTSPGNYSFSLTKNYLGSSKTSTFTNKVYVLNSVPDANFSVPFSESFENATDFVSKWTIVNQDNDLTSWNLNTTTAYTGNNCISLSNFNSPAPLIDEIISPPYDLTTVQNPTLTFKLMCAGTNTNNADQLQVFISNNCGKTWSSIYIKTGTPLKTIPSNETSSYTPTPGSSDWREERVNILPYLATGTVRFKFVFTSGGGNNIFLDDINLDGFSTTGLASRNSAATIKLFPNPASNYVWLKCEVSDKSALTVEVTDILGHSCLQGQEAFAPEKDNTTKLDVTSLDEGVYFVNVKQKDRVIYTGKFIKHSSEQ
jgi:hypothetical protein